MGPLGKLDGVQRGADVAVLGQQEASEPAALVSEAHGQHEGQGLHQPRVSLWGQRSKVSIGIKLFSLSKMHLSHFYKSCFFLGLLKNNDRANHRRRRALKRFIEQGSRVSRGQRV